MFKTILILFSSVFIFFGANEVQAAKGVKKESQESKVKARYSFKKGNKNKKYIDAIKKRGGSTYSSLF
jgi:hypothetical protein